MRTLTEDCKLIKESLEKGKLLRNDSIPREDVSIAVTKANQRYAERYYQSLRRMPITYVTG